MKRIAAVSCLVAATIVLSACNNPKDASEKNFKIAAQQYLNSTYPTCYFQTILPVKETSYLYNKKEEIKHNNNALHLLAQKGLLTEKEVFRKHDEPSLFSEAHDSIEIEYTLTDEGKKYFKPNLSKTFSGDSIGGFCTGKARVVSILNFTEPSDVMGQKISHVAYTYKVTDIPEWAKSEDIKNSNKKLKEAVKSEEQPITAKDVFILTNKGWMQEGLFRKK